MIVTVLLMIAAALFIQSYAVKDGEVQDNVLTGYATTDQCPETNPNVNACPPKIQKKECYPVAKSPFEPGTEEEVEVSCTATTTIGSTIQVLMSYLGGAYTATYTGTVIAGPTPATGTGGTFYTCLVLITHQDSVPPETRNALACDAAKNNANAKLTSTTGSGEQQAKLDALCQWFASQGGVNSGCTGERRPKPTISNCFASADGSQQCVCMEWHCKFSREAYQQSLQQNAGATGSGD